MKKTLLLAALAFLGFGATHADDALMPKAPVTPVNGGYYYIYDAHADDGTNVEQEGSNTCRYAFRYDSDGNIYGTHVKPYTVLNSETSYLTNAHVWKAITSDEGATWTFQNVSTGNYIGSSGSLVESADEAQTVVIQGTDPTSFTVAKNTDAGNRWDGNGPDNYTFVYWSGDGHPIHFYQAVADEDGESYQIDSAVAVQVTYTFNLPGEGTFSVSAVVPDGGNAANYIPSVADSFTATGLAESNTTVSETNNTFTVEGTWGVPFGFNYVYRMDMRQGSANNCVNWFYNAATGQIETRSTTQTTTTGVDELVKERLFYLTYKSLVDGVLVVNLHTLAADPDYGFQVAYSEGAIGTVTDTPTDFYVVSNSTGTAGISLRHIDSTTAHVNDINGKLGLWTYEDSQNDAGSYIRFLSLTDDDFDILSAGTATEEEIAAAKANPTYTTISYIFSTLDPLKVALKNLSNAIAAAEEYPIGTEVCQYSDPTNAYAEAIAAAKALLTDENVTEEAIAEAIEALSAATAALVINQPSVGHYYRLHYGDYYLSSNVASNDRMAIENTSDADALNNTTVFFYDGDYLVSFPDGLVVPKNLRDETRVTVLASDTENAGHVQFEASPYAVGKYLITTNSGVRYLYHADSSIDAGDSYDTSTGYQWELTEVTSLPVPHDETAYFSVCVPVDLNITEYDKAQHHAGVIKNDALNITAHSDALLAAGTPAVLEYKQGIANDCVYFTIAGYPEVSTLAEADVESDLTTIENYWLAQAPAEGKTYYVVEGNQLVKYTGETLPANVAFVVFDTPAEGEDTLPDSYTIVAQEEEEQTSIAEIAAALKAADGVVYDLQGRRVARPANGIYVINGTKVLIK